ncbi:MAG: hypothetical protein B7C24_12745 [Bacteroidetes bacterium 4572_77]|nr:MAG: hypothetical protein B7C24_12745 [Bacteroidetes bacterium 4572_77]
MKAVVLDFFATNENKKERAILNSFINGMDMEGVKIETVHICEKQIDACQKCVKDLSYTPTATCLLDDDMNKLYPKLDEAEFWVFAFPFFTSFNNTVLVNVLNRFEPLFLPNEGPTEKSGKMFIISTSASWDIGVFNPMVEQLKDFASLYNRTYAGAILRPDFTESSIKNNYNGFLNVINKAAKKAGEELIINGKVSEPILETISATFDYRKAIDLEKLKT